jgi:hypothetical protein
LVLMVTLLARGTVADVDEQLDNELVTLLAPVGGQLWPHDMVGARHRVLRWLEQKTLVHHAPLLVIHKA